MAAIGAASAMIGLPVPIFKGAKELLDRKKLVRLVYPPHPLCISGFRTLVVILFLQLAPGKTELVAALTEYERHINLLKSLYNNNRALFEHSMRGSCFPFAAGSHDGRAQNPTRRRRMADLDQFGHRREGAAGSYGTVEILGSGREDGGIKCEDR